MKLNNFSKRIYYDNTDAGGVVYHTEYIKFCEQARSEIFFENGFFFEDEFYVVKELNAKFIKPAKLGDLINVKSEIKTIKKASIIFYHEIFRKDELLFQLEVILVFIKNDKISKIPQKHLELFK